MVSLNKFIQEGGFNQNGGYKVTEIFDSMLISDTGVYDKRSLKQIEINNTSNPTEFKDFIKIINISNQKINLGIDRILYGDIEDNEPIYSIQIKYQDYSTIINVEGEENAQKFINNYGNIITHLNKLFGKQKSVPYTPLAQGIRVY